MMQNGIAQKTKHANLIALNKNVGKMVGFHPSFSRHGITRASSVLLIWLNENVHKVELYVCKARRPAGIKMSVVVYQQKTDG